MSDRNPNRPGADGALGKRRRRGIYVLPSLVTTASLFTGFYAIIQATGGHFEIAAMAIFVAMILDGLDGHIARWTHTASDFGKEYDSLADVVSFGLTPALVMFEWALSDYGKLGWLCAFLYCACTALRLARFNSVAVKDKGYFQGLPCPAAAALIAGWIWVVNDYQQIQGVATDVAGIAFMVAASMAMVSNLPYRSFKDFDLKNRIPFVALVLIVAPFLLIAFDPPWVLFCLFLGYLLSGPTIWFRRRRRKAASAPERASGRQSTGSEDAERRE